MFDCEDVVDVWDYNLDKYCKENKENIPEYEKDDSAKFFRLDEPWICPYCDLRTTSAGKVIAKCPNNCLYITLTLYIYLL